MNESPEDLREAILHECDAAAPGPWYPRQMVEALGVPREVLDTPLEQLRLGGLIELTEWEAGKGQGYRITRSGQEVLRDPDVMSRLRGGRPVLEAQVEALVASVAAQPPSALEALRRPMTPHVTRALLALNLLVFLGGVYLASVKGFNLDVFFTGSPPVILQETGAIRGLDLLHGEWWRLLTCCFVHIGLFHLGVNMYTLYIVGPLLEKMWGHFRYLLLYLISGLCGSCMMVLEAPLSEGAGASGALFGVMGSMGVWVFLNRRRLPPQLVRNWAQQLIFVLGLNILITFAVPQISKGAHFGGLAAGALASLPLAGLAGDSLWRRGLSWLALLALPVACVLAIPFAQRLDPRWQGVQVIYLEEDVLPRVNALERDARKDLTRQLETLLTRHPQRRDPEQVRQVETELQSSLSRLGEAAGILEGIGPFTGLPEEARTARLDYLRAEVAYYERVQTCFQKGDGWTQHEEDELLALQKEMLDARGRWQQLLQ